MKLLPTQRIEKHEAEPSHWIDRFNSTANVLEGLVSGSQLEVLRSIAKGIETGIIAKGSASYGQLLGSYPDIFRPLVKILLDCGITYEDHKISLGRSSKLGKR